MNLFGYGKPSPMNIHERERNKVAESLGYRSYSQLRTKGSIDDLLLCESEVAYNLSKKIKELKDSNP